jgi:catalase-peroxidase
MRKRKLSLLALLLATLSPIAFTSVALAEERPTTNQDWWPDRLDLRPLRQHAAQSNPLGAQFSYTKAFQTLDLKALKSDTYRIGDGRGGAGGGQQRFEPLNSWPDNVSLDKARRLLWPIKQKYGSKISWADLMVLTGNVALENMGFKTIGFAGGRADDWEPDMAYWGTEKKFLGADRFAGNRELKGPLAATQMGLIYVNPQGPNGIPDPIAAASDIRQAFGRMAMGDEEIVALIAGGHTFGKAHGAQDPDKCLGAEPAAAGLEQQGLGWDNKCGKGNAADAITSGLEGAWTGSPIQFTTQYLDNLFGYDWVQTKSPAGAIQWTPGDSRAATLVPDAHEPGVRHAPIMFTTDIAIKQDPVFKQIAQRFRQNPKEFIDAFARAWFKLTHRDMGPLARYVGADVPKQSFIWQDPLPTKHSAPLTAADADHLKTQILDSGLGTPELVRTAWAAAASFRGTDKRGGVNGARLRLAPQKDWAVNDPQEVQKVLTALEHIQSRFNHTGGKNVSLADLIVLGGNAAIERAAQRAGNPVQVPFRPGRVDASQAQTDAASFAVLEPMADGFRNYYGKSSLMSPTDALIERATLLNLTVPEMTVLLGGMRSLNANTGNTGYGVLTDRPGSLSNDFFVNLLSMSTQWKKSTEMEGLYEGRDRASGKLKWKATPVDLVFGSNAELRAVAEVYAANDGRDKFVKDFVAAWTKVMNLDRFD